MEAISQLKSVISSLRPELRVEELELHKRHMLSLVDALQAMHGAAPDVGSEAFRSEAPHMRLSRREREVLNMLLDGQRLKEIAARLEISVKTVTTHRSRLMRKLNVDDNLGLYRYGIRNGLIGL